MTTAQSIEGLIRRVKKTRNGFTDIKRAANEIVAVNTARESLLIAKKLYASPVHQARMLATLVLGRLAARSRESLALLRERVSQDDDWRVQEMLAQAFDTYCAGIGYEQALPAIRDWLADSNSNVRRAVTEGLRIWTSKPYFREHPDLAIKLLSRLRDDESDYVRRSVGNALRDISRKYRTEVQAELAAWDVTKKNVEQTYKLAKRFL